VTTTLLVDVDAGLGDLAPPPPLHTGTRFEAPWQARLFGMTVAFLEARGLPWDAFRGHLVRAVAGHRVDPADTPATAYYAAWLSAFESLLDEVGEQPGSTSAPQVVS